MIEAPAEIIVRKPHLKPIYRPHSKFSLEEDVRLRALVGEHGTNWRQISKCMEPRNSRQCRERWQNYLNPSLNVQPWTDAEDALLEKKYEEHGRRWVQMTQFFPNRTDAMLKNRFQVLSRKSLRAKLGGADSTSQGDNEFDNDIFYSMIGNDEKSDITQILFVKSKQIDTFAF
jgi:hypothetical protein